VSDACLRLLALGGSNRTNKLATVNDLAGQSRAPCGMVGEQIALAAELTESSIVAFSNFLLALKEVG
jgi:hypothetical protein